MNEPPSETLGEWPQGLFSGLEPQDWKDLEDRLGYHFVSLEVLQQAFIHESLVNEIGPRLTSNERLEFLGDSVLGLTVVEHLFRIYPKEPEGHLAQIKSYLVSKKHLALCAERLNLGPYLQVGKGEFYAGGRRQSSLLANCLEAVLGAVFLDGGFSKARRVILGFLGDDIKKGLGAVKDEKTRLQEKVQTVFQALPEYRLLSESGPPHDRRFEIEVRLADQALGFGEGHSKREAGRRAAKQALKLLREHGEGWYHLFVSKLPVHPGSRDLLESQEGSDSQGAESTQGKGTSDL